MWAGGGMWLRSDVTSGRNRRWEWPPDAGDAEDGKTTSDASGRGARASDVGLIFADVLVLLTIQFVDDTRSCEEGGHVMCRCNRVIVGILG